MKIKAKMFCRKAKIKDTQITLCSWDNKLLSVKKVPGLLDHSMSVSHGICKECSQVELDKLRRGGK